MGFHRFVNEVDGIIELVGCVFVGRGFDRLDRIAGLPIAQQYVERQICRLSRRDTKVACGVRLVDNVSVLVLIGNLHLHRADSSLGIVFEFNETSNPIFIAIIAFRHADFENISILER